MLRDDKMPIMQHEVRMSSDTGAVHAGKSRDGVGGIFSRPVALHLAICTAITFLCAFIFLMLFLATPIFVGLAHPEHHHHGNGTAAGAHDDHEEGGMGDRRRRDVEHQMQQLVKLCGCLKTLSGSSHAVQSQLELCVQNCIRSHGQKKPPQHV